MGRRSIPDVVLKNEGSMMQTCRNINVLVVNTDIFWKKNQIFVFPCCSTYSWRPFHWCINYYCRTDIDEARVISAVRHEYLSQNSFPPFLKGKSNFWVPIREELSIDVSNTAVELILTKLGWFFSPGTDRQTDTNLESSYGNMSSHKKFQLKPQN